jgi:hypothetical protein
MRRAISAPGERRPARALQLDIAPLAVAVQHFAKQDRAAVAKLSNEIAELMRGISHRDRLGARWKDVAGKYRCQLVRFDSSSIYAQFFGEQFVELDQAGLCDWCWRKSREKTLRQARIAVGEDSDRAARAFGCEGLFHPVSQRHGRYFHFGCTLSIARH